MLERLPLEIHLEIAENLDIHDIVQLKSTCRNLNQKLASEQIWRVKVLQEWFNIDLNEYSLQRAEQAKLDAGCWYNLAIKRYTIDTKLTNAINKLSQEDIPDDQRIIDYELFQDILEKEYLYVPHLRRLQMRFDTSFLRLVPSSDVTYVHMGYFMDDWIQHNRKRMLHIRRIHVASEIMKVIQINHLIKAYLYLITGNLLVQHDEHLFLEFSHADPSFYDILPMRKKIIDKILNKLQMKDKFSAREVISIILNTIKQYNTIPEHRSELLPTPTSEQSSLIRLFTSERCRPQPVFDALYWYIVELSGLELTDTENLILSRDLENSVTLKLDSMDYSVDSLKLQSKNTNLLNMIQSIPKDSFLKSFLGFEDNQRIVKKLDPDFSKDNPARAVYVNKNSKEDVPFHYRMNIPAASRRFTEEIGVLHDMLRFMEIGEVSSSGSLAEDMIIGELIGDYMNSPSKLHPKSGLMHAGFCFILEQYSRNYNDITFNQLVQQFKEHKLHISRIAFSNQPKTSCFPNKSPLQRGTIVYHIRHRLEGIVLDQQDDKIRVFMEVGHVYICGMKYLSLCETTDEYLLERFASLDGLGEYFHSYDPIEKRFL